MDAFYGFSQSVTYVCVCMYVCNTLRDRRPQIIVLGYSIRIPAETIHT